MMKQYMIAACLLVLITIVQETLAQTPLPDPTAIPFATFAGYSYTTCATATPPPIPFVPTETPTNTPTPMTQTPTPSPTHDPLTPTATPTNTPTPVPTPQPLPTETPFYAVGNFYLKQTIWLRDNSETFSLVVENHTTHDGWQADQTIHLFEVTVTNYSAHPVVLPLSMLTFIRYVDTDAGEFSGNDSGLEYLSLPLASEVEEATLLPSEPRTYQIAIVAPAGAVSEIGIKTNWHREAAGLLGAVPIWIDLVPNPNPCLHGKVAPVPPPPTPAIYGQELRGIVVSESGTITNVETTMTEGSTSEAVWPMIGAISRGYGCQPLFTGVDGAAYGCPSDRPWFHAGIDISAPAGTHIVAPMDGSILFAGADTTIDCSGMSGSESPHFGYGNFQKIQSGRYTHYLAHQQAFVVTTGAVTQGQPVGFEGSTGCSTGPHLHWTVKVEGAYTDPASIVK